VRTARKNLDNRRSRATRLSRIHPYPAIVADELALSLAERYVKPWDAVLDPFCGSGRLLAAAARVPGERVGMDVNPLACLLTRAKLANPDPTILVDLLNDIGRIRSARNLGKIVALRENRKVQWFSPAALRELSQIVAWINTLQLREPERLVAAAILSATARETSYARKDSWKLHRLPANLRSSIAASPWTVFEQGLQYCVEEISREPLTDTNARVYVPDARYLPQTGAEAFDVVFTSPPYGDSRTTVQYGAASALCLEFASRIDGLEDLFAAGGTIDASCLGGRGRSSAQLRPCEVRPYWAGRQKTEYARAVTKFLDDYNQACTRIAECLKPGGSAILVVGQRSTGGYRLKLDQFTIDRFEVLGLQAALVEERRLREKHLPRWINRYARSSSVEMRARGRTRTMSCEIILAFRKGRPSGRAL
jgi:site-specific DNA-methyltransferase (cytosine-N4-specific)